MNDTFTLERDVSTDVNYSVEEICRNEYEAFSYMVTRHPLCGVQNGPLCSI